MNDEMKNFLNDLVELVQDKYNLTLELNKEDKDSFKQGENFAYHDVLDLIESQITAFGYDPSLIGNIEPVFGEKASK